MAKPITVVGLLGTQLDARSVGLRGGLRRAARLRAATRSTPDEELPRPHHHGHARRADLPLPAHRGAATSRGGCCRPRRRARARQTPRPPDRREPTGALCGHRPGPVEVRRLAARFEHERRDARTLLKSGIETRNPAFNKLIERIEQVSRRRGRRCSCWGPRAPARSLARAAHLRAEEGATSSPASSSRSTARRCGATPPMLRALRARQGRLHGRGSRPRSGLRKADGGMLFLDEIGELGQDEQAMLLRAVEEKVVSSGGQPTRR
jgi:hypothetical protein